MFAFRKARIFGHLLHGMWTVATRFPNATPQVRMELNRLWSIGMLRRCGMTLVVHNDQARLDSGALVVGNHVSWIDIYVVNAWRPTPFVSKAEVRGWSPGSRSSSTRSSFNVKNVAMRNASCMRFRIGSCAVN